MFGVVVVGSESEGVTGSIGCTSLVRGVGEVMVNFSLRDWPHQTYNAVAWELTDADTGGSWPLRHGGVGGDRRADGRGSYDGCVWFERRRASRVLLRARLGDTTLLTSLVARRELPAIVCDIEVLDVTGELPARWEEVLQRLKRVEPRRAIADAVLAVGCPVSHVGSYEITPIALERWGSLSRLLVHVAGWIHAAHDQAMWWHVRMPGRPPQWAVLQQFGSGGVAHLLLADNARSFDLIARAGGVTGSGATGA